MQKTALALAQGIVTPKPLPVVRPKAVVDLAGYEVARYVTPNAWPPPERYGTPTPPASPPREVPSGFAMLLEVAGTDAAPAAKAHGARAKATKYRCHECVNCCQADCGQCQSCLDKPKNGGFGKYKRACKWRPPCMVQQD